MTYLTVPIAAANLSQAGQQVESALAADAEMLELRTDYLENLSVELVRRLILEVRNAAGRPVPIIVTCRDEKQGGALPYPQRLRVDVLAGAIKAGADFIDFEYENFLSIEAQEKIRLALSQSSKGRLILSAHNFAAKFADIRKLYRDSLAVSPAAIPKLVYTANHINDCFEAFDLLYQTSGERIIFCMGQAGLISRIIAKKLDSFVTFASIDEQSATASGQLTIQQLKQLYRYDCVNCDTELFGVIADPVAHSLSPAIHNACFAGRDMNKLYLPLLVQGGRQEFDLFLHSIITRKWLDFRGFSVTIPHKENALKYAKANRGFVEPLAEKIGAVNTLVVARASSPWGHGQDGRATGDERRIKAYNTDYAAALDAIICGMGISRAELKALPVAVVGAGGVARAIVAGLSDAGAKIKIYNRTVEKAERLAAEFGCEFAGLDVLPNLDAKLLINCTSIGMHPNVDETPVPAQYLKTCLERSREKGMAVFDTVYNPAQTMLLKEAKKAGAKTIDGLSMFINQALAQFKLFTGQDANAELMRNVVLECLRCQRSPSR